MLEVDNEQAILISPFCFDADTCTALGIDIQRGCKINTKVCILINGPNQVRIGRRSSVYISRDRVRLASIEVSSRLHTGQNHSWGLVQ